MIQTLLTICRNLKQYLKSGLSYIHRTTISPTQQLNLQSMQLPYCVGVTNYNPTLLDKGHSKDYPIINNDVTNHTPEPINITSNATNDIDCKGVKI